MLRACWLLCCRLLIGTIALAGVLIPGSPALALSAASLPDQPPADHVLDQADLLSRAAFADVSRALESLEGNDIDASWVSVPRLDYGLSLQQFGTELLQRWHPADSATNRSQLVFLVDGQTSGTAIVASPALAQQLGPTLLASTARTTMAQPLRDGARYRQASLDAIQRLEVVLEGGDDPGAPELTPNAVSPVRVPSREETQSSNALTWVAVLLVAGTVIPMLTWWVFSR